MSNSIRLRLILVIYLLIITALAGCTSRYRLDLFLTLQGEQKKVKVETTDYAPNTVLNAPGAERPVIAGTRSTAVLTMSMRGRESGAEGSQVFGFDEYLRVRMYLEFPSALAPDTLFLKGRAYLHMLGRFELPAADKIFLADSGRLVIDSVAHKRLYATIDGVYVNPDSMSLTCRGQFKIKIKD